jgi:PAS domain-containing protein
LNPVRSRSSVHPPVCPSASTRETRTSGSDEVERLLTENQLIGVIEFARDTWVLDCNDTIAQMLGYHSRRDLRGRHASELFLDGVDLARSFGALRPGDALQREVRMQARDGSVIRVAAHALCRPDDLQQPGTVLATFIPLPAGSDETRLRLLISPRTSS